jgi:hypothetical protein
MPTKIDIWSRGEVATHLVTLERAGQIKPCKHMRLEYGHAAAFYPRCEMKWASRVSARNVPLDITAYNGPSSYSWPQCPSDCPHFVPAENFVLSVSRDQYTESETQAEKAPKTDDIEAPSQQTPSGAGALETGEVSVEVRHLPVPERVTLRWLYHHVPIPLWVSALALLGASFTAGIQASRLAFVRDVFGLPTIAQPIAPTPTSPKSEPDSSSKEPAPLKPASSPDTKR